MAWHWAQVLFPTPLMLATLFFNLYANEKVGVFFSWSTGAYYDLLLGDSLGTYALLLLIASILVQLISKSYQFFSFLQKVIWAFCVVLFLELMLINLNILFGNDTWSLSNHLFVTAFMSSILWGIIEFTQLMLKQFKE